MLRKTLGTLLRTLTLIFVTGFDEIVSLFLRFSVCVNSRFPLLGSHVANAKPQVIHG